MIKIRIHPAAALMLLFPLTGLMTWKMTALYWLCGIAHETGHILAGILRHVKFREIHLIPFGLLAIPEDPWKISPKSERIVAAAGPAVNLMLTAITLALPFSPQNESAVAFLYCNAALAAVNLLPILPLDGGRILYYALAEKHDAAFCEMILRRCATLLLALLLYPVFADLIRNGNPSLLLLWLYLTAYHLIRRGAI